MIWKTEEQKPTGPTEPGDNGTVKIAVAGPGIPVDRLSKLFEPFFATKQEGIGMGLSIARTTVHTVE
jgi:C4-dicarboxylate-specific signal transduction histidine kinase